MVLKQALQSYAKKAWRQYCLSQWLVYLPIIFSIGSMVFAVSELTIGHGLLIGLGVVFLLLIVAIFNIYFNDKAKRTKTIYNPKNSADKLNQLFPQLQFSCQLALKAEGKLTVLQQLQLVRVEQAFAQLTTQNPKLLTPNYIQWKKGLLSGIFLIMVVALTLIILRQLAANDENKAAKPFEIGPYSFSTSIRVEPPAYVKQPTTVMSVGNITVLEGSTVKWRLNSTNAFYRKMAPKLKLGDTVIPLDKVSRDKWTIGQVVNQTVLYQLIGQQPEGHFSELHAITVTKDQAPDIRMLAPSSTLVTFNHDEQPKLTSKVLVSDDFAIGEVKLVTSLAKGSGEAVKFRDLTVGFDASEDDQDSNGKIYQKVWNFKALGMEPGDELYFSVHASDNKAPTPQISRSSTVIVRWLDGDQQAISADGLLLTYMPEYFRSQRQIIIETEQLIADMPQLSQTQIDDMSRSLGQSQQDLKLRFGQYLGDEVGQGPAEQAEFIGGVVEHKDERHEDDGHGHHEHKNTSDNQVAEKLQQAAAQQEQDHQHQHSQSDAQHSSIGSAQAVKSAFVHAHEEVHVGEVSTQNPKAMMKKAVSFMWQAELHLMLSEPKKALPFELQAYKYLKLAKQSERIYVKRLGFEPPPVSEEKRLTGELDEIESYQVEKQLTPVGGDGGSKGDIQLFSQAFSLLNAPVSNNPANELTTSQQQLLKRLKARLSTMVQTRPALIHYVLSLEKILMANTLKAADCEDCVASLSAKLWQLIEVPASEPAKRQADYLDGDQLALDFVKQANLAATRSATKRSTP